MKSKLVLATLGALLLPGASVFAASGSAAIAHFHTYHSSATNAGSARVWISNVTNQPVDVTVTVFNQSGTLLQDGDDSPSTGVLRGQYNVINFVDAPTGASATFTVGPHETVAFRIVPASGGISGYGSLAWKQTSDTLHALVAHVEVQGIYRVGNDYGWAHMYSVPINGGKAF